jgi:hypothetical protein
MPILYVITLYPNQGFLYVRSGNTWPPGNTQTYTNIGTEMTLVLQYFGGTYVVYEYEVLFDPRQIPSDATVEAVTLYAYVSYASLGNSPIYLNIQYYQGGSWWVAPNRPQVTSAGQTLIQQLPLNSVTPGTISSPYRFRAIYTTLDSAPTTTNQFNIPLSQIWLEVAVTGGIQMIV